VEVLVTDEQGAPLEGVAVSARASLDARDTHRGTTESDETDASGRVTLADVYAPAVDLSCGKSGYLDAELAGVPSGTVAHVRMTRGLTVTLRCSDPNGRPAPVDAAWCRVDERHVNGQAVERERDENGWLAGSATWLFEDLPDAQLVLKVRSGGREFELEHAAREPEARLSVPEFGALIVHGLQSARDAEAQLVIDRVGEDPASVGGSVQRGHVSADRFSRLIVFPGRYVLMLKAQDGRVLAGPLEADVLAGLTTEVTLR
jgi:hypothetical protein